MEWLWLPALLVGVVLGFWLGARAAAEGAKLHRYGIGRTKLYELLGAGALKASKLGAKTLIDVESADSFFSSLPDFRAGAGR